MLLLLLSMMMLIHSSLFLPMMGWCVMGCVDPIFFMIRVCVFVVCVKTTFREHSNASRSASRMNPDSSLVIANYFKIEF